MKQFFAFALIALVALSGCIGQTDVTEDEKRAIFNNVDPAVDRMMQGFNDGNHMRFSADFGDLLKQAMDTGRFMEYQDGLVKELGLYVTRGAASVERAGERGELYSVTYQTEWEKRSGVSLSVTFVKGDPSYRIQGLQIG